MKLTSCNTTTCLCLAPVQAWPTPFDDWKGQMTSQAVEYLIDLAIGSQEFSCEHDHLATKEVAEEQHAHGCST